LSELAQGDLAVGHVADDAWGDPVQAYKAQATEDTLVGEQAVQLFFVAQAVLQRQQHCVWPHQRR
jgi:hypothetical protein